MTKKIEIGAAAKDILFEARICGAPKTTIETRLSEIRISHGKRVARSIALHLSSSPLFRGLQIQNVSFLRSANY